MELGRERLWPLPDRQPDRNRRSTRSSAPTRVRFEATVTVAYQLEESTTEGGSYNLPDGSEVNEEGTYC